MKIKINNRKQKNGFTLIELIVVMTIIAVISVTAIVSYSGSSKRSRDSRRMADLEKVRMALEMYRQEKGLYPSTTGTALPAALTTSGYMQSLPADPVSTYKYDYVFSGSYSYFLRAHVEDLGSTNRSSIGGCNTTCNYEVTNP